MFVFQFATFLQQNVAGLGGGQCAVPENIHTPPQKELEFPDGLGVL